MFLKLKFILPIAIFTGFLATFGAYHYIQKQSEAMQAPEIPLQNVVVARSNLAMGTALKETDLIVIDWPEEMTPKGCYSSIPEISGRVLKTEVYEGEVILKSKLAPEGSKGGFACIIPTGMRALTVTVNTASGVGGFILPGTHVDVLVTVPSLINKEESTTKIILEDIQVLAIDQDFERKDDDPVLVQSVTLLVTPNQAEKLVLASTEGKLQLSLRNDADHVNTATTGVKLSELISKPEPIRIYRGVSRRVKPKPKVVEIIRSNERSEVTFDQK